MRIAVTGAGGFLGRNVIAALNARNLSVTLVLRPGAIPTPDMVSHRVVHRDLHGSPVGAFDALEQPDLLIHLAWAGLPNYCSPHHVEDEYLRQSALLSQLVLDGLGRLVVSGTCLEYGMQSGLLEESLPTSPSVPYAIAKDLLHRQMEALCSTAGASLAWLRIFYLFGEGQAPGSLYSQLHAADLRGDKEFPMSGGEQIRDYLPAAMAAELLLQLALNPAAQGTINLCSGEPVSVRDMVRNWIAVNRWAIQPKLGIYPYPDYEPMEFWGSRRKLDEYAGAVKNLP